MTKVLLTGVGGSIGCHTLAHILKTTDWDVIGIDSFRHKGLTDRVTAVLAPHPGWAERTTIFTHDLTAPISEMLARRIGEVEPQPEHRRPEIALEVRRTAGDEEAQVTKSRRKRKKGDDCPGKPVRAAAPVGDEELERKRQRQDESGEQRPEVVEPNA